MLPVPKFAYELLQVQLVVPGVGRVLHRADVGRGVEERRQRAVGSVAATAVSLAPLTNRPVSVLVKASLLLLRARAERRVATVGGGVAAGADDTWSRCTAGPPSGRSASTAPSRRREPFMRMHSLFGVTITPLTSVVSELPRKQRSRPGRCASLFELVLGWTAVKLATLSVVARRVGLVAVAVDLDQRVAEARALEQQRVLDVRPARRCRRRGCRRRRRSAM